MSPEARPGVDGAVDSWGTWAGGDSPAAGAAFAWLGFTGCCGWSGRFGSSPACDCAV